MKLYLLGIMTPVVIVGLGLLIWRAERWKTSMGQTLGKRFMELAAEHDATAAEWEWKLYGDGWSGWAGWDCGRQADGLYRNLALTLIKHHRETAKAIRAELPYQPGYNKSRHSFEVSDERQREWQEWYDDFYKRNNLPPTPTERP